MVRLSSDSITATNPAPSRPRPTAPPTGRPPAKDGIPRPRQRSSPHPPSSQCYIITVSREGSVFKMRLLLLLLCLAGPACSAAPLKVVASFSILADLAAKTGGDLVSVTALVGPGADLHEFQPRPEDARKLAGADLVLINGMGAEGWIGQLVAASGFKGPVVILS